MEDKYLFCVRCEEKEEFNDYANAVKNANSLYDIYEIARRYDKHLEPTKDNFYKLCEEIKEISWSEK